MAFVITGRCVGVKDASCVSVCPSDCIHPTKDEPAFETADRLYIDPDACIDCALCAMECPVDAIFAEEDLTGEDRRYVELNAAFYQRS